MPIYEYRCADCGHEFETIQKVSEEPLSTCPDCGKDTLKKKVSAAGFRLKGGGWYETDFKSGGKKNVAEDAKGSADAGSSAAGEDGGSSGKTDATPAKSAESSGSSSSDSGSKGSSSSGNSASASPGKGKAGGSD